MRLGVIADDFTGATDIASFLVQNGLSTIQFNGVPHNSDALDAQAIVISLKSRSCPVEQAIEQSLAALSWLQQQGCERFYFKYCSTFDSTERGNIGPVTDALLAALGETQTVICPALPVNGRTVYQGHLFVGEQLLSDSGMRHHPVTPMTDSNLLRLMERQAKGKAGLIASQVVEQGVDAVRCKLDELREQGIHYVAIDTLNEQHLLTQGEALRDMRLVTGGSGLAIGLARQWAQDDADHRSAEQAGRPQGTRAIVISGSCSQMTNRQVSAYRQQAPAQEVQVERCLDDVESYALQLCDWVDANSHQALAPLLFATADAQNLQAIQQQYGAQRSSEAVENLFAAVTRELKKRGWQRFIVAGGETSGVVAQSLGVTAFHIGPTISPGVPWVRDIRQPLSLALKSGNFGDEHFFRRAQTEFSHA
ncbi:MAG: four-carbon acid sugar kinase family protein [Enterobacterales bacterium endosymbiont of Blomia tropicalis]|uniref:3-oxo-tetronate kinase n=1 Tax=Mixta mediterraneensis TaxID=2758443 RepID=UPI0025A748E3|nr:3-oxo-tetronate kinase [Mixta mediterraneensis]MDL4914825.1 four-carbon acid sugar kinase family protein [Mixta mediterraneensis]